MIRTLEWGWQTCDILNDHSAIKNQLELNNLYIYING